MILMAMPFVQAQNTKVEPFKGVINVDVRDSKADWGPYIRKKAPEGLPNILFILYDDTGLGAWSPYGGRINMPTMDKLAADGLTYTQWHTVALCSPTRSWVNTGRNQNLNEMGTITEGANGFPGYSCQLPAQTATISQILNNNGWSTFWLGKGHNVPEAVAVNVRGKSFKIVSNVQITANASGLIFAHGSGFGGHSLFIKDHKLY